MIDSGTTRFDQPIGPDAASQRLVPAVLAALGAALLGAVLWAGITVVTDYQIGFMAIGVGVLVGFAVRLVGKGETSIYRAVAAIAALLGCAVGNLLTGAWAFSVQVQAPVTRVLEVLDAQLLGDIMLGLFSPIDLLFYGLAVHQAWKLAVDDGPGPEDVLKDQAAEPGQP